MQHVWFQAIELAERTPEERNRYVDFLRAVSILMVVTGHWLVAAPWYVDGELIPGDLLELRPETQWMTWIFQVMPIFFIVGGYANAVSLESAKRRGVDYAGWLATRLYRLVTPLLGLLLGWSLLALALYFFGVEGDTTRLVTRAALIPTWFLAIYIAIVMLAPLTYKAWEKWGFVSLFALAGIGALVDIAFFAADLRWLGWSQYFWVWLSVHHLGYAWRDGRLGSPARLLAWSALGFVALWLLIFKGPYPFAMVGSPDEGLSNTLPPKITLLALGICQFGLLLSIEKPMRRLLSSVRLWAATVLINSMIMTLYLWHITVMIVVVVIAYFADGAGLGFEPGTSSWWLSRIVWVAVLYAILLPLTFALSALERRSRPADAPAPSTARQVLGALMICLGIAYLALFGFGSAPLPFLDIIAFFTVVAGSALSGLLHGFR
ncbi:MAG: acyltransferase family protein [Woeseiaceae bacterium]|nr:acyltransferase family protein [Woeseiaceae bacterium]NIP19604.1 acyltransferase family protein [Woeseiaceae bacterium]NIS89721.1 acyltransferase family protein [Woeseiaceae bacterium]